MNHIGLDEMCFFGGIKVLGETREEDVSWDNESIRELLARGGDVNTRDEKGRTPLFYTGNAEITQMLIDAGADVNARDKNDQSPLFHVENTKTAQRLIDAGADPTIRDISMQTAKDVHLLDGREEVATLLKDAEKEWEIKRQRERMTSVLTPPKTQEQQQPKRRIKM